MLVCDMNVIRLYNTLSRDDIKASHLATNNVIDNFDDGIAIKDSFIITEGSRFLSSFTAMVYDESSGIIYFTDTTR